MTDYPGYAPLHNAPMMVDFAVEVMSQLVGSGRTLRTNNWGSGSTDMGNVSCVMPVLHPYIGGAAGKSHGDDYRIVNPENACLVSAEGQLALAARLLENDAAAAEAVIASYHAPYEVIPDGSVGGPLRFHPGLPRRLGPLREIGRPDLLRRWAGNGVFRVKRSALRAKQ